MSCPWIVELLWSDIDQLNTIFLLIVQVVWSECRYVFHTSFLTTSTAKGAVIYVRCLQSSNVALHVPTYKDIVVSHQSPHTAQFCLPLLLALWSQPASAGEVLHQKISSASMILGFNKLTSSKHFGKIGCELTRRARMLRGDLDRRCCGCSD